jgi:hypothetical protein
MCEHKWHDRDFVSWPWDWQSPGLIDTNWTLELFMHCWVSRHAVWPIHTFLHFWTLRLWIHQKILVLAWWPCSFSFSIMTVLTLDMFTICSGTIGRLSQRDQRLSLFVCSLFFMAVFIFWWLWWCIHHHLHRFCTHFITNVVGISNLFCLVYSVSPFPTKRKQVVPVPGPYQLARQIKERPFFVFVFLVSLSSTFL